MNSKGSLTTDGCVAHTGDLYFQVVWLSHSLRSHVSAMKMSVKRIRKIAGGDIAIENSFLHSLDYNRPANICVNTSAKIAFEFANYHSFDKAGEK